MRERVVIKWGGGLITQKDRMKTVRTDVLDHLADQFEVASQPDLTSCWSTGRVPLDTSRPRRTGWQTGASLMARFPWR